MSVRCRIAAFGLIASTLAAVLLAHAARGGEPEADWPCWRGPTGGGAAPASNVKLVSDPKKVKLLWRSEEEDIPSGWLHPNGYGNVGITGGYGAPLPYQGRVYLTYWLPSGEVCDETSVKGARDKRREKWLVAADDVLLCADADTGKTIWKVAMAGKGINHQYHNHCSNFQLVAAGGRVYWTGSGGWAYAVDATTGATVWQVRLGKVTDAIDAWKKAGIIPLTKSPDANKLPAFDKCAFNSAPAVAEGVVVFNDHEGAVGGGRNGLLAVDAQNGEVRWRVRNCIATISAPVVWTYQGRRYFVAAGPERAVALDPKTGQVLWEILPPRVEAPKPPEDPNERRRWRPPPPPFLMSGGTPAVCENYLVLNGQYVERGGKEPQPWMSGWSCWRITPERAALAWSLPPQECGGQFDSPFISHGHVFMRSNGVLCVRLEDGKSEGRAKSAGDFEATIGGDGRLFLATTMYSLDPKDFGTLGAVPLAIGKEPYTTAGYCAGRLFVRAPKEGKGSLGARARGAIFCYDLREN